MGIFVLTCVSGVLTYMSIDRYPDSPPYVAMVRMLHYFVYLFSIFYLVLFDAAMDVVFFILMLFIYLHWYFFNNECILSYYEHMHYIPDYKLGTLKSYSWYTRIFFGRYTNVFMAISGFVSIATFVYVLMRQHLDDITTAVIIGLVIAYLTLISVWKSSV